MKFNKAKPCGKRRRAFCLYKSLRVSAASAELLGCLAAPKALHHCAGAVGGEDLIEELRESELQSTFLDEDGEAVLVSETAEDFYDKVILKAEELFPIEPLPNYGLPEEEEEEEAEYFH